MRWRTASAVPEKQLRRKSSRHPAWPGLIGARDATEIHIGLIGLMGIMVPVVAACSAPIVRQAEPRSTTSPEVAKSAAAPPIRIENEGAFGVIFVPVTIGDQEYTFLVDTGATNTFYDSSLRHLLGERIDRVEVSTVTGDTTLDTYSSPEAWIKSISIKTKTPVLAIDLAAPSQVFGEKLHGVVGMDVLHRLVVRLNFDEGWVELSEGPRPAEPSWGSPIELELLDGNAVPAIKATVAEDIAGRFLLDTGDNSSISVPAEGYDQLVEAGDIRGACTSTFVSGSGAIETSRYGVLSRLSLGPFEHRDILVGEGTPSIGLELLNRYVSTLHFPQRKMYLSRGARFHAPDLPNMSGMHIFQSDGQLIVYSVDDDGPAKSAGIRGGDRIAVIDGRDASELRLAELSGLFRSERGRRLTITVGRGDELIDTTLTLDAACLEGER